MVYSRIDIAICNREWVVKFPNCEIETLDAHISMPLMVKPMGHCMNTKRCQAPFKFLNYAVEHPEFMDIVRNNWE